MITSQQQARWRQRAEIWGTRMGRRGVVTGLVQGTPALLIHLASPPASVDEASTLCHSLLMSLAKCQSGKSSPVGFPRSVIA